jgi:hypothetical protein
MKKNEEVFAAKYPEWAGYGCAWKVFGFGDRGKREELCG